METLKFKTNIKCGGCIATVTPILNNIPEISKWEVDIEHPEKTLTIQADEQLEVATVVDALGKAGFTATETNA